MFIGKTSVLILTVALSGLAAGQTSPQQTSGSPRNAGPNNAQVCGSSSCSSPASNSESTWRWDGSQWTTTFSPGQAPTLGPSFSDYLNNLTNQVTQTLSNAPNSLFQAVEKGAEWESNEWTGAKNNPGGALAAVGSLTASTVFALTGNETMSATLIESGANGLNSALNLTAPYDLTGTALEHGTKIADALGTKSLATTLGGASLLNEFFGSASDLAEQGAQINHPPVYLIPMPYFDPLEPVKPVSSASTSSQNDIGSPFVTVNPDDITIIDPAAPSGTDIIEIDAPSAQQMLQAAKQSHDSLLSEQQQLMNQSTDYQQQNQLVVQQSQQALDQNESSAQAVADRAFATRVATVAQRNASDGLSTEEFLQRLSAALTTVSQPRTVRPGRIQGSTKGPLPCVTASDPVSAWSPLPAENCSQYSNYASEGLRACMYLACLGGCDAAFAARCQSDYARDLQYQANMVSACGRRNAENAQLASGRSQVNSVNGRRPCTTKP